MTDAQAPIDWYLARDGQQYGPLNEAEMRAFVDLGHLQESDLIWRPGFADWQPAPNVFAIHQAPAARIDPPAAGEADTAAAVPVAPVASSERGSPALETMTESGNAASRAVSEPAALEGGATAVGAPVAGYEPPVTAAAATVIAQHPTAVPQHPHELFSPDQLSHPHQPTIAPAPVAAAVEPGQRAPQMREPAPVSSQATGGRGDGSSAKVRPMGARPGAAPVRPAERPGRDQPVAVRPVVVDDMEDDDEPRRRVGFGRIAAALVFALLVGGLMAAVIKRDEVAAMLPRAMASLMTTDRSPVPAAVAPAAITTPDAADQQFQRLAMWRQVKKDFPEWYSERIQEAAKLAAEKRPDAQINRQLVEALVALRRKHADQALTASPERLRYVARAFLGNLQALAKQNVDTCYGFISQGETHPAVLAMVQKPEGSDLLQAQIVAVFEAIADGRRAPQSYLPPRKADYDALAAELTARGWSEDHMRVFSDPRALGRASPHDVCRMVQDWFAAQIAIKDPDTQVRLLVESLRPVVAG